MSAIHDVGGRLDFGAIETAAEPEGFHHEWEARVFAINRLFLKRGTYNLDEFRYAVESLDPTIYAEASYYERWLLAIEALLRSKGVLDAL